MARPEDAGRTRRADGAATSQMSGATAYVPSPCVAGARSNADAHSLSPPPIPISLLRGDQDRPPQALAQEGCARIKTGISTIVLAPPIALLKSIHENPAKVPLTPPGPASPLHCLLRQPHGPTRTCRAEAPLIISQWRRSALPRPVAAPLLLLLLVPPVKSVSGPARHAVAAHRPPSFASRHGVLHERASP